MQIGAVGWGTVLQARRPWVRFLVGSLEFFVDLILLAVLWPCGNAVSNRNKYQWYPLGHKGSWCIQTDNLTTLSRIVRTTSWSRLMGWLYLASLTVIYNPRVRCNLLQTFVSQYRHTVYMCTGWGEGRVFLLNMLPFAKIMYFRS